MAKIRDVLLGGPLTDVALEGALHATYIEVTDPLKQYSAYFLRLLAATVIATGSIAANAPATIIGAMLVAPLMSPMLGVALGLTLGRPKEAVRCLGLTLLSVAIVLAGSAAVTAIIPIGIDVATNSQVLARTEPRLVDLIIALAAGFMAALSSMRSDIPNVAPGVATSGAIVPPLCVAGAALFEGSLVQAGGALLLFLANFVAIQVMGTVVYLLMGLGTWGVHAVHDHARRTWYALVGALAAVVVYLLLATSQGIVAESHQLRAAQGAVGEWVANTKWRVTSLEVDDGELFLQLSGNGKKPGFDALADDLRSDGIEAVSISYVEEESVEL